MGSHSLPLLLTPTWESAPVSSRARMRGALLLLPLLGCASALPQGGFLSGIGNAFNNFFGGDNQGSRPPPRQAQRPRPQQPPRFQQQQLQQQHQTTFGRTQGTMFSEGTWQHGRLAAPHSSSTRPRLTASRWAWSRSPSTAPPSRTTSTD